MASEAAMDAWIEKLKKCVCLTEHELKQLCDRVGGAHARRVPSCGAARRGAARRNANSAH
jgi:hypothetical protein